MDPSPFLWFVVPTVLLFAVSFLCIWTYAAVKTVGLGLRRPRVLNEVARTLGLQGRSFLFETSSLKGRIRELDVDVGLVEHPTVSRALVGEFRIRVIALRFPPPEVVELVLPRLGLGGRVRAISSGLSQTVSGDIRAPAELVGAIEGLVTAVERASTAPIPEFLAANLATGCPSDLRLKSIKALLEHYPKAEETAWVLNSCSTDYEPEIRYLASQETSPSALEAFATDRHVRPELRLDALELLATRTSFERLSPLLGKVIDLPGDGPQIRALRLIASRRDKAHTPRVCEMAASGHSTPAVAEALAEALLSLGARSEPTMLGLLESQSESAQAIAIKELREWGTVSAVEPLLQLRSRGAIEEAARSAVRAIQSRIAGAEVGRVSLVESVPTGGVSVVPEREKG
ncbi:MAG TPA: hypothetical protein VGK67_08040 [Myxococcales bacterium]|jgi:hypothetical protein